MLDWRGLKSLAGQQITEVLTVPRFLLVQLQGQDHKWWGARPDLRGFRNEFGTRVPCKWPLLPLSAEQCCTQPFAPCRGTSRMCGRLRGAGLQQHPSINLIALHESWPPSSSSRCGGGRRAAIRPFAGGGTKLLQEPNSPIKDGGFISCCGGFSRTRSLAPADSVTARTWLRRGACKTPVFLL